MRRDSYVMGEIRPTSVVVQRPTGIEKDSGRGGVSADRLPADAELMTRPACAERARRSPMLDPDTFETNVPSLFIAGGAVAGEGKGHGSSSRMAGSMARKLLK